jgi:beta-carotene 3-hydroxylase
LILAVFFHGVSVTWHTIRYAWLLCGISTKDHHQPKYENPFELNDIFFYHFAIPSIALFYFGAEVDIICFYRFRYIAHGLGYFMIHDVLTSGFKWSKTPTSI